MHLSLLTGKGQDIFVLLVTSRSFMLVCLRKFALPGERGLSGLWPESTFALKPAHVRLIFHPAASNHPPSWAEVFRGVIGQQSALDCCTKPGSTVSSVKVILCQYSAEHVKHVRLMSRRLLENWLFVKAEKCEFHAPIVSFLGFLRNRVAASGHSKG